MSLQLGHSMPKRAQTEFRCVSPVSTQVSVKPQSGDINASACAHSVLVRVLKLYPCMHRITRGLRQPAPARTARLFAGRQCPGAFAQKLSVCMPPRPVFSPACGLSAPGHGMCTQCAGVCDPPLLVCAPSRTVFLPGRCLGTVRRSVHAQCPCVCAQILLVWALSCPAFPQTHGFGTARLCVCRLNVGVVYSALRCGQTTPLRARGVPERV